MRQLGGGAGRLGQDSAGCLGHIVSPLVGRHSSGLATLSEAGAEALAGHGGWYIFLFGLTGLAKAAASGTGQVSPQPVLRLAAARFRPAARQICPQLAADDCQSHKLLTYSLAAGPVGSASSPRQGITTMLNPLNVWSMSERRAGAQIVQLRPDAIPAGWGGIWLAGVVLRLAAAFDHRDATQAGPPAADVGPARQAYGAQSAPEFVRYRGEELPLGGPAHLALIKRALRAKFTAHPDLAAEFVASAPRPIRHDTGRPDRPGAEFPRETFCRLLSELRDELRMSLWRQNKQRIKPARTSRRRIVPCPRSFNGKTCRGSAPIHVGSNPALGPGWPAQPDRQTRFAANGGSAMTSQAGGCDS